MSNGFGDRLRRFLDRGRPPSAASSQENHLRPPGAVAEERFMALCIRCSRCLEVCPYGSVKRAGWGGRIGTPFVLPESKACYLCMACSRLCPTGALDNRLREPEEVRMGKAGIDPSICYSHLFFDKDVLPESRGKEIGAICTTCYTVCPFPDKAIMLKDNLVPVVLADCVGCGICVERCPTRPRRAVNVIPAGMREADHAGLDSHRVHKEETGEGEKVPLRKVLKGDELLERKQTIEQSEAEPDFPFPYDPEGERGDWE